MITVKAQKVPLAKSTLDEKAEDVQFESIPRPEESEDAITETEGVSDGTNFVPFDEVEAEEEPTYVDGQAYTPKVVEQARDERNYQPEEKRPPLSKEEADACRVMGESASKMINSWLPIIFAAITGKPAAAFTLSESSQKDIDKAFVDVAVYYNLSLSSSPLANLGMLLLAGYGTPIGMHYIEKAMQSKTA
jgi:hypothetical protein